MNDTRITIYAASWNRVVRERDEAREEAKKLDGAYEDATNYYARWSELIEERDEAREELKQLKEQ
jgi:uncharacterized coiled-coil DUF342 family protein